ncbi:MAG: glycosyltransferase [Zoogloeaceae bacterium]|nr:glycosyltransferase [Zoogloeaceae bacterium]
MQILSIFPEYKFYIRHHYVNQWETVLYALPPAANSSSDSHELSETGQKSIIDHSSASPKAHSGADSPCQNPASDNLSTGHATSTPKVSIILTSYNHEKFLDEAIESALAQTYQNFELIIWDDASTDGSWAIIEQYNDPRIISFRNEAQRYATYNLNRAISEVARGEYIAIHHSDDVWEPEKLEKQVAFLDQHPETGAVFSWVNIMDERGNLRNDHPLYTHFRQGNKTRYEWLRHFFVNGNALCHPSVLIRKQCYLDCGLYNLALWKLPDFDLWVRLCFRHEIHVLPEYLVRYRWGYDGRNTSAVSQQTAGLSGFEYFLILNHYRRIANAEEFLKIFPSSGKYCAPPDADLEFALAMTAIELNADESYTNEKYRLFGLSLLAPLIGSPERGEKLRAIHHFDHMDFAKLVKQLRLFAPQKFLAASQKQASPLEQGINAFNQADHATAIECLSTAMTEEPENPLPAAYLAFICVQQGLVTEARDFIAQALILAPDRADLIAALGEVLLKNNRPLEAVEYLREAIHIQPDLFAAYPALAQSLRLTGQNAEAIALLQGAAGIPSDAQAEIQTTLSQIQAESK